MTRIDAWGGSGGGGQSVAWGGRLCQAAFVLPDERTSPGQFEAFRRMTPERRLALGESLYWSARELKTLWLRAQHPDWSEAEIAREIRRIFLHART